MTASKFESVSARHVKVSAVGLYRLSEVGRGVLIFPPFAQRPAKATLRDLFGSAVVLVFLYAALGTALPTSKASSQVGQYTEPVARVTGFHQRWGLFAPEPTSVEAEFSAVVTFSDGSNDVWRPPKANRLDSGRVERWRKWDNNIRLDSNEPHWPAMADYIERRFEVAHVVAIDFVVTWSEVPDANDPPESRTSNEYVFYWWDAETRTGKTAEDWKQP